MLRRPGRAAAGNAVSHDATSSPPGRASRGLMLASGRPLVRRSCRPSRRSSDHGGGAADRELRDGAARRRPESGECEQQAPRFLRCQQHEPDCARERDAAERPAARDPQRRGRREQQVQATRRGESAGVAERGQHHEATEHGAHDRADRVPGIDARARGSRVGAPARQDAHREREGGADRERGRNQDRHREGRVGAQPAATAGTDLCRQRGYQVERAERCQRERCGRELRDREAARRPRRSRRDARADGAAGCDADQHAREHRREGVDAAAEHVAEQPCPQHFVAEGGGAREQHDRQDPRGMRERRRGRLAGSRGVARAVRLGRRARDRRRQHEDERIQRDAHPDRCTQAERRQQHEAAHERAADRAGRVDRVERADARAQLAVAADGVRCEQRKRGPHEGGGHQQDRERAQQVEERARKAAGVRGQLASAQQRDLDRDGGADRERHGQRGACDAEFEESVHEDRFVYTRAEAAGEGRAAREPAHVGREHRGHGELGGSENRAELARPGGLVEQGGKTRQEETREQRKPAPARGSCSDGRVHRGEAGSTPASTSASASATSRWPNAFG